MFTELLYMYFACAMNALKVLTLAACMGTAGPANEHAYYTNDS